MKPIFPWIRQLCRRRFRDLKLVWARRFRIRLRSGWDGVNWLCSVLGSNDWRRLKDCWRNWKGNFPLNSASGWSEGD
ncbi:hypothetical protein TNIN_287901 [Trichonephila inaurata madagascariensis]|uniref:Uncharacterized protein n=1 Tax=Trichonephila inaurata madagascariensis TaxID=2747483 RepID=A0A8X7CGF4_9ARAC|nr:hypothetical protein TNIN_287901 [Trichonephila inaurata madagascariensis]